MQLVCLLVQVLPVLTFSNSKESIGAPLFDPASQLIFTMETEFLAWRGADGLVGVVENVVLFENELCGPVLPL